MGLESGAEGYLTQPVEPPVLIATVKALLRMRQAEEALNGESALTAAILDTVGALVIVLDPQGQIMRLNRACEDLTGYTLAEVKGRHFWDFLLLPEEVEPVTAGLRDLRTGHFANKMENYWVAKDGRRWLIAWSNTVLLDPAGTVEYIIGTGIDITERRQMEETIHHMAFHDSQTGLPNRAMLNDRLTVALAHARRHQEKLAVLWLDLDNFKEVNDTLGHSMGDALLQQVAARLTNLLRKSDSVARLGGDEFIELLSEIAREEDVWQVCQRIRDAFQQSFVVGDHEFHITTSIGIAIYPDDGEDLETLLKHADIAMYRPKNQGRNNWQRYA